MQHSINWNEQFAARVSHMRRSAVRELLKLTVDPAMISFAGGLPAPELFPMTEIQEAAETVLRTQGKEALQYGETEGLAELRDWIAHHHSVAGAALTRQNVAILSGAQQALDLIGRVLLDPGDKVLVENPTYLALLSAWRPLGVEFVGIPGDAAGLRLEALAEMTPLQPKLLYTVPNFQNPQGTTLSAGRRASLVEWARRCGVIVLEDDPYGELRFEGESAPDLFDLDATSAAHSHQPGNVIRVGTFSKVLAPGLRVGWVTAPPEVIDKIVLAKQAADLHTSGLSQRIIHSLLAAGLLDRHLPRLRQAYQERRDAMLQALERHFPAEATWTKPAGGMFLLVTLPPSGDAAALLNHSLQRQVAFVPGEEFHLDGAGRNTFRLNFSNASPDRIEQGIQRLGELLKQRLHLRKAAAPSAPSTPTRGTGEAAH